MGCGEFIVKYILFFANLFFALAGLTLLGLGVAVELQISAITDVVESNFSIAPISAMVVGGIVFLIAFFGCCGAIRESNCMLVVYAIFMLILMVLKITLATMIFLKLGELLGEIPGWMDEAFKKQEAFHSIENTFRCCGPKGSISYGSMILPDSCCETTPCTSWNSYSGCTGVLQAFFNTFGLTIGSVAVAVGAVELVAVIFALCLANHARNKDRRSRY